eukprot:5615439-Pyramimonas_sp.AAC.1
MRTDYLRGPDVHEWVDRAHLRYSEQAQGVFFAHFKLVQDTKPFIIFGNKLLIVALMRELGLRPPRACRVLHRVEQ